MKKIFYYIIISVLVGIGIVSYWVYGKYFEDKQPNILEISVQQGSVDETIRARGFVSAKKEFDLEFPFSGTVDEIFVEAGDKVKSGDLLMQLDLTDINLELARFNAKLDQANASLEKLIRGPIDEDINILETKVISAKQALLDAEITLENASDKANIDLDNLYGDVFDIVNDAYTKADDAVNKQISDIFSESTVNNFKLTFNVKDQLLKNKVEQDRLAVKNNINYMRFQVKSFDNNDDKYKVLTEFESNLKIVREFLSDLSRAVDSSTGLNSTTSNNYKGLINTGRVNMNTAISSINNQIQLIDSQKVINQNNLFALEAKVNDFKSVLKLAENNLSLKKAGARSEDLEIARAKIVEINSQIAIIKQKIKKSSLYAPGDSVITKVWVEEGEIFRPGLTAVSLSTLGNKIEANISELEIGKIKEFNGNDVLIEFDAFPGRQIKGKIVFIDPKEQIIDNDKYYRIDVYMEPHDEELRSGMSADLVIKVSSKDDVLKIPEFAVDKKEGGAFVNLLKDGQVLEIKVELGIVDGEYVEVLSGLKKSDIIAVIAD